MATRKTKAQAGNQTGPKRKRSPVSRLAANSSGTPPPPPPVRAASSTGRPAAVWFDDEDRKLLRELSVLVLKHNLDPSHSLILRALLRAAPRDERLIKAVRALTERDGRRLRHRKAIQQ